MLTNFTAFNMVRREEIAVQFQDLIRCLTWHTEESYRLTPEFKYVV